MTDTTPAAAVEQVMALADAYARRSGLYVNPHNEVSVLKARDALEAAIRALAAPKEAEPKGCTYPVCECEPEHSCGTDQPATRGESPGNGWPDWPDDMLTFPERAAYQRGIHDARQIAASPPPAPVAERELPPLPEMLPLKPYPMKCTACAHPRLSGWSTGPMRCEKCGGDSFVGEMFTSTPGPMYTADQMHAFVLADRAALSARSPAQGGEDALLAQAVRRDYVYSLMSSHDDGDAAWVKVKFATVAAAEDFAQLIVETVDSASPPAPEAPAGPVDELAQAFARAYPTPDLADHMLTKYRDLQAIAARVSGQVPGWQRVEDSLPPKFTEVLVFFAGQCSIASTGQYTGNPRDHDGWCYPDENRQDGEWPTVTHWQLLPDDPMPLPAMLAAAPLPGNGGDA